MGHRVLHSVYYVFFMSESQIIGPVCDPSCSVLNSNFTVTRKIKCSNKTYQVPFYILLTTYRDLQ